MKKILRAVVLGSLLTGLIIPLAASAQPETLPGNCTLKYDFSEIDPACTEGATVSTDEHGICCMLNSITTATNWLFYILTLIVVIMIIVGGFTYMTAAGDPEKAGKGKTIIVYALIGLAIALFAKAIPSIVKFVIGV